MVSVDLQGMINYQNFLLKPVGYYNKIWKNFDMAHHTHPYYELMFIEEGECKVELWFKVDSRKENISITLTKNMAIFINSSIFHKLIATGDVRILHIEFEISQNINETSILNFKHIIEYTADLKQMLQKNLKYYILRDAYDISSTIKHIHSELMERLVLHDDNFLLVQAFIIELFIKIAKIYKDNSYRGGIGYIKSTISYIKENYTDDVSIVNLAEKIGVSKGYLHRLIKKETGKTFTEIVNKYRIEKARHMITATNYPLVDIAIECGFNTRQSFHHIFKEITGVSPREYRKNKGPSYLSHFDDEYLHFTEDN